MYKKVAWLTNRSKFRSSVLIKIINGFVIVNEDIVKLFSNYMMYFSFTMTQKKFFKGFPSENYLHRWI